MIYKKLESKKIFSCISCCFFTIFLLSSCNNVTNHTNETATEAITSESSSYLDQENTHVTYDLNDYVHIDADYSIPDDLKDLKMNRILASRTIINDEKCKKIFLDDQIPMENTVDEGYHSREIGKYDMEYYQNYENNMMLSLEKMDMFFSCNNHEKIENCLFTDKTFESYNLDQYSLNGELPFGSHENIFSIIKKAYKDAVGIEISDNYQVYALDHETLQQEQNSHLDIIGEHDAIYDDWSVDDDTYYFILSQDVDGIPIYQNGYGDAYEGTGVDFTQLTVLYDKNGWLDFRAYRGYCIEKTEEVQKILNIEQALESLKRKFDLNVDQGDEWNIDDISLQLVPVYIKDNNYEIRPVWMFKGVNPKIMYGYFTIMIDAVSGKEIIQ